MGRLLRVIIGVALALGLGLPSAQASDPDLSVYRLRSLVDGQVATTVHDQYPVTFRAFAKNLGPGTTSDMFVTYSNTRRLYVKSEVCIVPASESGDFNNVSPDTPSCEWSDVPEGDYAIVRVKAFAVGQPGQHVSITFCSSNGQSTDDGDPSNDCQTARLTISTQS
jgi:hypothetical protein